MLDEMVQKFIGDADRRVLVQSLRSQALVHGSREVAEAIASVVELMPIPKGAVLIEQDTMGTDMFFILAGSFAVLKNGRQCGVRGRDCHVGDMAMIEVGATRSATIKALEDSVVARVTEQDFAKIPFANDEDRWRQVAVTLSRRLREVTPLIAKRNEIPRLFIGSSSEALPYANVLRDKLKSAELEVTVWDQNVFLPSRYALETLEEVAKDHDFALMLFHADDIIFSREKFVDGPRDNVVLEAGIFIGSIGRKRTFVMAPKGVKIPSDLAGITVMHYTPTAMPVSIPDDALTDLRRVITEMQAK